MAMPQRVMDSMAEGPWQTVPVGPDMEQEFFTEAEYFDYQETAFGRWEWVPVGADVAGREGLGVLRAMSGGTPSHSEVASNLNRAIGNALEALGNPICRVHTSDLKVHCADGRNTFPDLSVVCGKPSFHAGRNDIVTNPLLLCEVLSPSTEAKDRGPKWRSYQTIPTLQHYLLVSATEPRVEVYTRQTDGEWRVRYVNGLEAEVDLPALGVTVAMATLYRLVEFGTE